MHSNRREFLKTSALGATAALALGAEGTKIILVESTGSKEFSRQLAERELVRGLTHLRLPAEVRFAESPAPAAGAIIVRLRVEPEKHKHPESYTISASAGEIVLSAAGDQALRYAVFDFLEREGIFFGIDGDNYPMDPVRELVLPPEGRPWSATPRFATRGLLPWPDFLNCITVYNIEDFRAYFDSMMRMRFNTFGMHVYTGAEQWTESYLSYEFAGAGHLGYLDTTATNRWGYLPQRTSTYGMGAADLYDQDIFGSDAMRLAQGNWDMAERTRKLLQGAFSYASHLGIRTGIGFEPYQIPDEIFRALPPEIKNPNKGAVPRFDVESVVGRKMLETRLAQLLEAYPSVDYVWLWEDEGMNWNSRKTGIPLSTTPFLQAHDFLRRNAPKKRLVVSGWGGVARHFEDFHKRLPGDVIFSCLSDTLGWDPVNEVFGKLEGRERWPIPWLEDDPGMWLPQFHVHRFQRDLNLAAQYGCQGVLGIHWRHRIVDPTAGYQARFSWDPKLAPDQYFHAYSRTQASGSRAPKLAEILNGVDRDQTILTSATGKIVDGHAEIRAFSGDYSEAFCFWSNYTPAPAIMESQKKVAEALRALTNAASSPLEKERLGYLTGHVEFLAPYAESWTLAHQIHLALEAASKLKAEGKAGDAREMVRSECVPLWLKLAPKVREAVLDFQNIVATRNDLGTLASIQNKYVRLALIRLRLSMLEFLGELPPETENLFAEVMQPEAKPEVRVFMPTRPSMFGFNENARMMIIVTGAEPIHRVGLYARVLASKEWSFIPAKPLGARTYLALLGPFDPTNKVAEYYVTVDVGGRHVNAPPEGAYALTLA